MLIAAADSFIASLEHILGFLVVVAALCLLWALTAGMGWLFAGREVKRSPLPAAESPGEEAEEEEEKSGPDEEEVAAIMAVVAILMGQRSRIVSIRKGSTPDWSREGRREHFASHRIR